MATAPETVMPELPPGAELEIPALPPLPPGAVLVPSKPAATAKASEPTEDSPSLLRRFFSHAGKMAKGMPIPMATTAGGAAAGTALWPGPGTIIGALLGGGGGEWLNQKFGLTEPSKTDIALSAITGPFGQTARPGVQGIKTLAVKSLAGRGVVSEAAENVLKRMLNPAEAASEIYKRAESLGINIPAKKTVKLVDEMLAEETGQQIAGKTQKELVEVLTPVKDFYAPLGRFSVAQPVKNMMAEVRRLGTDASAAFEAGKTELGYAINQVRATILDDLEASGAGIVKDASRTARKEHAIKDLANLLGKPHPSVKVADFARNNPLFKGAFSEPEMAQINRIVKKLDFVAPSGASGVIGRTATATAGVVAGGGWFSGLLALVGVEGIHNLLASPVGRNMTEKVLEGTYKLDGPRAAALAMIARGLIPRGLMGGGESDTEQ